MKTTILVPLAGYRTYKMEEGSAFPKILNELNGKLLLEKAASALLDLDGELEIIVVVPKEQIKQYNLDKVLFALDSRIRVVSIEGETQGATCTALLAIDHIDLCSRLIITSFEQVLDLDLNPLLEQFFNNKVDCGLLTFNSIHPRFSYVLTDEAENVLQAAEKKPISRQALAGLYYYESAELFFECAKETILNGSVDSGYYLSNTINEYVLKGRTVKAQAIPSDRYFHFYDSHNVEQYEYSLSGKELSSSLLQSSKEYVKAFDSKDIEAVSRFFSADFHLVDPGADLKGYDHVVTYLSELFESAHELSFKEHNIIVDSKYSVIEFELTLNDKRLVGTDVITWDNQNKMVSMHAYLYEA